ncbi:MAG: S24/S26 family peptidase [Clostridia bacterium]|nr:S24/S26 family peptidase [Clostridia bacterium]
MENSQIALSELWPVMKEQIDCGKTVIFSPNGTSMLPLMRPNIDRVMLKKAPKKLKKYDIPLYLRDNGQFVLHRVVAVLEDGYVMCGDHQYKREYGVKDGQILAIACGMYKGDDFVPFDGKKYINYCKKQVAKKHIYGEYMRLRNFAGRIKKKLKRQFL